MYSKTPAYIFGFHGCSKETYDAVIHNNKMLPQSINEYDWLGSGIYFWENSYQRAAEWANERYGSDGEVLGAIINLGHCLDLMDYRSAEVLKNGYEILKERCQRTNKPIPENNYGHSSTDRLIRNLDCAVINSIHKYNSVNDMQPYDSVRGMFEEGNEMYPGAGFKEKTHTQVCIINPNCIKGFFTPREKDINFPLP